MSNNIESKPGDISSVGTMIWLAENPVEHCCKECEEGRVCSSLGPEQEWIIKLKQFTALAKELSPNICITDADGLYTITIKKPF